MHALVLDGADELFQLIATANELREGLNRLGRRERGAQGRARLLLFRATNASKLIRREAENRGRPWVCGDAPRVGAEERPKLFS